LISDFEYMTSQRIIIKSRLFTIINFGIMIINSVENEVSLNGVGAIQSIKTLSYV